VLEEKVRPDASDTLAYFADQGVAVKVISGDNPSTVGAIAARVGVTGADRPLDARELPDRGLADALEEHSVFGRVQPHQQRAIVIGALTLPFPFLPRHLTIVSSLTIGIPGFFLALAPNSQRFRPGFVRRVLHFAVPAGTVAAAATFSAYALARAEDVSLLQA